jgi:fumarate hydratase class II
VVLRDQRTCFGAKVFARKSSIPFITELAQTMGYDTAHQIAELAKSIGPTVPAAA